MILFPNNILDGLIYINNLYEQINIKNGDMIQQKRRNINCYTETFIYYYINFTLLVKLLDIS